MRLVEVEMLHITIYLIYTEQPITGSCIDRTVKIIHSHETAVLRSRKNPAQVIVPIIQELIVTVYRIIISSHHIVHDVTDIVNKVIVHFVHIIVLHLRQVQLICHTVGQETGIFSHLTHAHGSHCRNTHTEHQNHHPKSSQLSHNLHFLVLSIFFGTKIGEEFSPYN